MEILIGLLILGFAVYYFVVGGLLIGVFKVGEFSTLGTIAFVLPYIIFAIVVIYRYRKKTTKCPSCGKEFALKEVERHMTNSKDTIIRDYKDFSKYVPATEYTYRCVDRCKYCGHSEVVFRFNTIKK